MACLLEGLPPELHVEILANAPDLPTLHNLIVASPAAYRVFNGFAFEIFMSVLTSCKFMTRQLRALIEAIAHTRSQFRFFPARMNTLNDLRRFCLIAEHHFALPVRINACPDAPAGSRLNQIYTAGTSLWYKIPPSILRGILADAARINRLATFCIQDLLERLTHVEFRRPVDPKFTFRTDKDMWISGRLSLSKAWKRSPEAERYSPRLDRSVSLAEESIVLWTAWRLQLMADLKRASDQGIIKKLGWSKRDLAVVHRAEMGSVFQFTPPLPVADKPMYYAPHSDREWQYHEVNTFVNWLGAEMPMGDIPLPNLQAMLQSKEAEPGRAWQSLQIEPFSGSVPDEGFYQPEIRCGTEVFYYLRGCQDSPMRYTMFDPFLPLGMALWDRTRLVDLGLIHSYSDRRPYAPEAFFFQWRSLLTPEQRAEADERQAARYAQRVERRRRRAEESERVRQQHFTE